MISNSNTKKSKEIIFEVTSIEPLCAKYKLSLHLIASMSLYVCNSVFNVISNHFFCKIFSDHLGTSISVKTMDEHKQPIMVLVLEGY